jgi:hypothetical protein
LVRICKARRFRFPCREPNGGCSVARLAYCIYQTLLRVVGVAGVSCTHPLIKSRPGSLECPCAAGCNKKLSMRELRNSKARPGKPRPVVSIAAVLLGTAVLCQPGLAQAAHGCGGGGGTAAEGVSTVEASTAAGSTAASRAYIMPSPGGTRATGTVAGMAGAMAGGGPFRDWRGRIMIIRGGALIQIMTTTITVSLTPARPGTIAPIRQAIIRM